MIRHTLHDAVLEVVIDNPPVNPLSLGVRKGLAEAIAAANADPEVEAVLIRGAGKLFSSGADITEFDDVRGEPSLPEVVAMIESCARPVIAAIHGACLGGGLEVALACHHRIAAAGAKLGLPEVKLGLLPGAGGTQRLPRLVGAEAALGMIVGGDPISAEKALALGLVDRVVPADRLVEEAIAFARAKPAVRRTGEMTINADPAVFERFAADNARKIGTLDAPKACIEAVKASTELSLNAGLALEKTLFLKLVGGTQSQSLRHIFFAERLAGKIEGLSSAVALRDIHHVGVIGAGTMGGGISMNFLSAGIAVTIVEMAQDALDRGVSIVRRNYEASAAKGRLSGAAVESAMALLAPTLDFEALATCDLIIEAVYEDMDVKKAIFRRLDAIAKPGAMLASNTSFLDIDEIAGATGRPQDVIGLHFFSPANVMKLVEVVRGAESAQDAVATGMQLSRKIGKVPVVSGVCYGFIGNRMLMPRQEQATALLLEGATPERIDRVHTLFGMPMGPFQMADLAGIDLGWHRDPSRIESIPEALCAAGRFGQKNGLGYYDYDAKRRATQSAATGAIIDEFRARRGTPQREITDDEIVARTLYIMVNEGLKILEEGIAQRASDIDVVWVFGYGWPRETGGPMFWANQIGHAAIAQGLKTYRERLGPDFKLADALSRA